ncbi:MAG: glutathione S-transferase family protein [Myxococcota bacterium]
MLTLYHSKQSRSMRVVWLCEELGIDYTISSLAMFTPEMKTRAYLAIHPLGKVPAIDDDGFVLWETTAIVEYLATKHERVDLVPPRGTRVGALVSQWMAYGENPLTVIMGEIAAHDGPMPEDMRIPALVDRGRAIAPSLVQVVEHALAEHDYITGPTFTAADILLQFGLNIAAYLGFVSSKTPRCQAYCARLAERPAYQKALTV